MVKFDGQATCSCYVEIWLFKTGSRHQELGGIAHLYCHDRKSFPAARDMLGCMQCAYEPSNGSYRNSSLHHFHQPSLYHSELVSGTGKPVVNHAYMCFSLWKENSVHYPYP